MIRATLTAIPLILPSKYYARISQYVESQYIDSYLILIDNTMFYGGTSNTYKTNVTARHPLHIPKFNAVLLCPYVYATTLSHYIYAYILGLVQKKKNLRWNFHGQNSIAVSDICVVESTSSYDDEIQDEIISRFEIPVLLKASNTNFSLENFTFAWINTLTSLHMSRFIRRPTLCKTRHWLRSLLEFELDKKFFEILLKDETRLPQRFFCVAKPKLKTLDQILDTATTEYEYISRPYTAQAHLSLAHLYSEQLQHSTVYANANILARRKDKTLFLFSPFKIDPRTEFLIRDFLYREKALHLLYRSDSIAFTRLSKKEKSRKQISRDFRNTILFTALSHILDNTDLRGEQSIRISDVLLAIEKAKVSCTLTIEISTLERRCKIERCEISSVGIRPSYGSGYSLAMLTQQFSEWINSNRLIDISPFAPHPLLVYDYTTYSTVNVYGDNLQLLSGLLERSLQGLFLRIVGGIHADKPNP